MRKFVELAGGADALIVRDPDGPPPSPTPPRITRSSSARSTALHERRLLDIRKKADAQRAD
ncbi:MAG: hypothetical protein IPF66_17350 [Holophagales bacterium]|nr:hypothetical protein [Holophagales bacterium]